MRINAAARFAPGIIEGPLLKRPNRFTVLPVQAAGLQTIGLTVLPQNIKRVACVLLNFGTGNVYISSFQSISASDWPITPGTSLSFIGSDSPTAPMNALYAIGDAGHDLRVLEIVLAPLTGTEFQA